MNTNFEVKGAPDPQPGPPLVAARAVTTGPWYERCPVCRADWTDGQLWIARGGPPCRHLRMYARMRADGSVVRWMTVTRFPRLQAWRARLALAVWTIVCGIGQAIASSLLALGFAAAVAIFAALFWIAGVFLGLWRGL